MDIKNVKVIDLSKVKNCWLVQMLPFTSNDKKDNNLVNDYQEFCLRKKFFGIGWSDDYDDEKKIKKERIEDIFGKVKSKDGELTKDLENEVYEKIKKYNIFSEEELKDIKGKKIQYIYQKVYNKINPPKKKENNQENETVEDKKEKDQNNNENSGLQRAINSFFSIEKGDMVITRLRNGTYLIGQVEDETKFFEKEEEEKEKLKKHESNGFSWRCKVDEWIKLQRNEVPSDIIGRFSQRNPKTILKIGDTNSSTKERIKLLALKLYQEKRGKEKTEKEKIEIPQIILNQNNFGRSLNSDELENLVYLYIILEKEKNENLILLPSNCKISEPMYEFYLKDKNNIDQKSITCQVKNIHRIEYSEYLKQVDLFKKIYLFSGINDYGENVELNEKIEIINQQELYECLIRNLNYFPLLNNKEYYKVEEPKLKKENINKLEYNFKIGKGEKFISLHKPRKSLSNTYSVLYYKNEDNEEMYGKILKINFGNFQYNNEFKCFIIDDNVQEAKKIIEEIKSNEENNDIFKEIE